MLVVSVEIGFDFVKLWRKWRHVMRHTHIPPFFRFALFIYSLWILIPWITLTNLRFFWRRHIFFRSCLSVYVYQIYSLRVLFYFLNQTEVWEGISDMLRCNVTVIELNWYNLFSFVRKSNNRSVIMVDWWLQSPANTVEKKRKKTNDNLHENIS